MKINIDGLEYETPTYWLEGTGKWKDHDGDVYEIVGMRIPFLGNGKHVYLDTHDGSASYRDFGDGEILSFQSTGIQKEDV